MSESYLHHALNGAVLDQEQARSVFEQMSRGELSDIEIAAFLGALHAHGEQPSEIAGAAEAFRQAAQSFSTDATGIIDVVGTGGDGVGTINVSTASAFVAASMGLKVAKHGNRAVSSKAGAADLIEAAGIPLDLSPTSSAQLLERTGFCFLFAQKYHPAMRFVAPVRAALKNPTIFNLIGPLVNPAHLSYQVLGVGKRELFGGELGFIDFDIGGKGIESRRQIYTHPADVRECLLQSADMFLRAADLVGFLADGHFKQKDFQPRPCRDGGNDCGIDTAGNADDKPLGVCGGGIVFQPVGNMADNGLGLHSQAPDLKEGIIPDFERQRHMDRTGHLKINFTAFRRPSPRFYRQYNLTEISHNLSQFETIP